MLAIYPRARGRIFLRGSSAGLDWIHNRAPDEIDGDASIFRLTVPHYDPVQIKLETFPFTRYGTIEAEVRSVTADAVNDEQKGAIFPSPLTLKRSSIVADGKRGNLSPGRRAAAGSTRGRRPRR